MMQSPYTQEVHFENPTVHTLDVIGDTPRMTKHARSSLIMDSLPEEKTKRFKLVCIYIYIVWYSNSPTNQDKPLPYKKLHYRFHKDLGNWWSRKFLSSEVGSSAKLQLQPLKHSFLPAVMQYWLTQSARSIISYLFLFSTLQA